MWGPRPSTIREAFSAQAHLIHNAGTHQAARSLPQTLLEEPRLGRRRGHLLQHRPRPAPAHRRPRHRRHEPRCHRSENHPPRASPPPRRRTLRDLPLHHAPGHHRRLARDRVRPPQRPLRQSGTPVRRLLPHPSHRRHHGAHHQRPQRRPPTPRPRHHVQRQLLRLHRSRVAVHDPHQPQAHALRRRPAAARIRARPILRPAHSPPLRTHPGHVLRHLRQGPGELFRRAPHPRLRPGRRRDRLLRNRQPGIHRPLTPPRPPDGHALALARTRPRTRTHDHAAGRRTRGR